MQTSNLMLLTSILIARRDISLIMSFTMMHMEPLVADKISTRKKTSMDELDQLWNDAKRL
ncbi:MAG: hypothetical protein V7776_23550 [Halopseudomonas aestusnigri]